MVLITHRRSKRQLLKEIERCLLILELDPYTPEVKKFCLDDQFVVIQIAEAVSDRFPAKVIEQLLCF